MREPHLEPIDPHEVICDCGPCREVVALSSCKFYDPLDIEDEHILGGRCDECQGIVCKKHINTYKDEKFCSECLDIVITNDMFEGERHEKETSCII